MIAMNGKGQKEKRQERIRQEGKEQKGNGTGKKRPDGKGSYGKEAIEGKGI